MSHIAHLHLSVRPLGVEGAYDVASNPECRNVEGCVLQMSGCIKVQLRFAAGVLVEVLRSYCIKRKMLRDQIGTMQSLSAPLMRSSSVTVRWGSMARSFWLSHCLMPSFPQH